MPPKKRSDLLTAADVAKCCRVDMKTIHNWAGRGELPHFRTPGRHLRFERADVLDFLRRYGYPVPEWLMEGPPRVVLTGADEWTENVAVELADEFEVSSSTSSLRALIDAGSRAPDAFVIGPGVADGDCDPPSIVAALKSHPATRRVRVVTTGPLRADGRASGASAHLEAPGTDALRATLEALLGLSRPAN